MHSLFVQRANNPVHTLDDLTLELYNFIKEKATSKEPITVLMDLVETGITSPSEGGEELTEAEKKAINAEKLKDLKCKNYLFQTIDRSILATILKKDTSKEIWDSLKQKYQKTARVEDEEALQVTQGTHQGGRGRGRGFFPRKGRGRGQGRGGKFGYDKSTLECYNCYKLGHFQWECPKEVRSAAYYTEAKEDMLLMSLVECMETTYEHLWFLDSSCSNHMCGNRDMFVELDIMFKERVKLGNDSTLTVHGKGTVRLEINGVVSVIIGVFFVPDLVNNLLSVGQLQEKGRGVSIFNGTCKVFHPQKGNMVKGIPSFTVSQKVCEDCLVGKQHRNPFPSKSTWRASNILQLVHADLYGPITLISNKKSEAFATFKFYKVKVEKETGVVHVLNRSPTLALKDKTPEEAWSGGMSSVETSPAQCRVDTQIPKHEGRIRRQSVWLKDYETSEGLSDEETHLAMFTGQDTYLSFPLSNQDPPTFEDVVKSEKWRHAMDQEIQAIERNNTRELTTLPYGGKSIRVMWVYKTKLNKNEEVDKYNARLVAKGCSQEYGVDYAEVFAPVARLETIRLVLALAAQKTWTVYQLDVKSAFLHGEIKEEVFVDQPPGYEVKGQQSKVYRLKNALYGLKQAPRAWYSRIEAYFIREGFIKCPYEHTLFIKFGAGGKILIVCLYVDDLIYTGNDKEMFEVFKKSMMTEFDMTDWGKMRYFLGIEVEQRTYGIFIGQRKYAQEMLRKFNMDQCNAMHNPIVSSVKLTKDDEGTEVDGTIYRQMVGSLMKGGNKELIGFTDSDYAGDLDDRKSTSGYVFLMSSGAVSWCSTKQPVVTLSTTEAEL
nr:putative RNA-directed DNA polymerase [Tanacetum cinerariifolium]